MNVQRYTWEDAVVDAQTSGAISNGALMVCLKLARAINWKPNGNKKPGLYWANNEAFEFVGLSRTSFYEHRTELFEEGFFIMEHNNLIPVVPESVPRTEESVVRTEQSVVRTQESAVRNPFSEDTFSDDSLSEDKGSEESSTSDDREGGYEYLGSLNSKDYPDFPMLETLTFSYLANHQGVVSLVHPKAVETPPESAVRTEEDTDRAIRERRLANYKEEEAARAALVSDW